MEAAVLISALFWFSIDFCIVLVGGQRRQERQRAGRRSQCGGCCIDFCVEGEVGGGEEEVRWR